jgi:hypothetical protein
VFDGDDEIEIDIILDSYECIGVAFGINMMICTARSNCWAY